jgi:hypothetical protein
MSSCGIASFFFQPAIYGCATLSLRHVRLTSGFKVACGRGSCPGTPGSDKVCGILKWSGQTKHAKMHPIVTQFPISLGLPMPHRRSFVEFCGGSLGRFWDAPLAKPKPAPTHTNGDGGTAFDHFTGRAYAYTGVDADPQASGFEHQTSSTRVQSDPRRVSSHVRPLNT